MNCRQCRELLSPYLDGVLTAALSQALEDHVRWCQSCREELAALRQTVELLRAWSEEELELPAGFEGRLRSRLEAACRPWYRRLPHWIPLAAAAAIMVGVAITAYADHFGFPHALQTRQAAPAFPQEEKVENRSLPDPATAPLADAFSLMATDQASKQPVQEVTPPQKNLQPVQPPKREPAKPAGSQQVINGREREFVAGNGNNVNSRGGLALDGGQQGQQKQKEEQKPQPGKDTQPGQGSKAPDKKEANPPGQPGDKQLEPGQGGTPPAKGGPGEKTAPPPAGPPTSQLPDQGAGAGVQDPVPAPAGTVQPLSVMEGVYQHPEAPGGNLPPAAGQDGKPAGTSPPPSP